MELFLIIVFYSWNQNDHLGWWILMVDDINVLRFIFPIYELLLIFIKNITPSFSVLLSLYSKKICYKITVVLEFQVKNY